MTRDATKRFIYIVKVVLTESIESFTSNNCFEMSAALATYGFFALIPLFFLLSYLIGSWGILSQTLMNGVESLIGHLFPWPDKVSLGAYQFFTHDRVTWGAVGLGMVFISLMSLADTLRTAFLKIFRVDRPASLWKTQLLNGATACILLVLLVVLLTAEISYSSLTDKLPLDTSFLEILFDFVSSIIISTVCMMILYRAFLPVKYDVVNLIITSLVTAALLITMRELFSLFLRLNPQYGLAFGSLKTLFIMTIWVYYCFLVILFGSEIIVSINKKDAILLKKLFVPARSSDRTALFLMRKFIETYATGHVLFWEGDQGRIMYYVLRGSVAIERSGQVISIMEEGDYFGEMSMLLDTPRTASAVVAEADTQLVRISQDNFEVILRENPDIVLSILKEMTMRLKITDESI